MNAKTCLTSVFLLGLVSAVPSCGGEEGPLVRSDDEYELVDPLEFSFEMVDAYFMSQVGEENGQLVGIPIDGELGSLKCNGHEIALASNTFDDGILETVDFEQIKIRISHVSGAFEVYLTPRQKAKLKEYLESQAS
jgi:hypothetical protein